MKKFLCSFMVLSLAITLFHSYSFAAERENANEVISFEEYYSAMREIYAEYGVTFEIIDANENYVYTVAFLNDQLQNAQEMLEANKSDADTVVISMPDNDSVGVYSLMPYAYSSTQYYSVISPTGMGAADFAVTLNATADAQHKTFLSIKDYTCNQYGYYFNLKSWTETSKSHSLSNDKQVCTVNFIGDLTIEYTDPITNNVHAYTSTHQITSYFSP